MMGFCGVLNDSASEVSKSNDARSTRPGILLLSSYDDDLQCYILRSSSRSRPEFSHMLTVDSMTHRSPQLEEGTLT